MKNRSTHRLKGRKIQSDGHKRVEKLPRLPESDISYWLDSPNSRLKYTHQLFRFPAKFHPPIVRWALGNYGRKGSVVLDPFTGSGTVQVEALVRGIPSVGIDVDPIACLIAQAKATPLNSDRQRRGLDEIRLILEPCLKAHLDREVRAGSDISEGRFEEEAATLTIPAIPNMGHWFKRYVIIDLARIIDAIGRVDLKEVEKRFFLAIVAAIIRRVSNADPDPVSGLEVTSFQSERNSIRKIKVFDKFFAKAKQAIEGMDQLWKTWRETKPAAVAHVIQGNTSDLEALLEDEPLAQGGFPLVITSPPYCQAVEYSRRHKLEMYWLGFIKNPVEHVALAHTYIGRKLVRAPDWDEPVDFGIKRLDVALGRIAKEDINKARTVRHYFYAMQEVFTALVRVVRKTATIVCVVGDSACCKIPIATADFIPELAVEHFILKTRFSYALRNHYMQYGLWNGEGIKQECVLVFKPR